MPWCPKCKTEYREGFRVCADCGGELVDEEQFRELEEKQLSAGAAQACLAEALAYAAELETQPENLEEDTEPEGHEAECDSEQDGNLEQQKKPEKSTFSYFLYFDQFQVSVLFIIYSPTHLKTRMQT